MNKMLFSTIIVMLAVCSQSYAQNKPTKIVTTIGQLTDAVKNIGESHVFVQGLMGAGVDPHLYKATEGDLRKISDAQMIIYNGLFLEAKMEPILEKMARNKKTVPAGEAVTIDKRLDSINYPGHYDPHIWFDVTLWMQVVQKIADELTAFDPLRAEEFQQNAAIYLKQLESLHAFVLSRATELPEEKRILVTAHDAFRYFGRAYGFEVVGLQGISTQAEAGTKDVMELADFITKKKIKAIFIESSVPERTIKAVQEAVKARGWDVEIGGELFSDAMGDEGTFEGTYIGMVTHNINTIVDALKE